MNKNGIVENFDVIEIETYSGKKINRRINVKKRSEDKEYIGMKLGDWFNDYYGRLQRIVGIQKNDPYAGLSELVPEMAKDRYDYGCGKTRKWKSADERDRLCCWR